MSIYLKIACYKVPMWFIKGREDITWGDLSVDGQYNIKWKKEEDVSVWTGLKRLTLESSGGLLQLH